jgi:hypothetical protein
MIENGTVGIPGTNDRGLVIQLSLLAVMLIGAGLGLMVLG